MPSAYERPTPRTFASCAGGTATTSPARADTALAGRSAVTIFNEDTTVTLRVSQDSAVSASAGNAKAGIPVAPGTPVTLYWSDKVPVYVVAASSVNYVILEEG